MHIVREIPPPPPVETRYVLEVSSTELVLVLVGVYRLNEQTLRSYLQEGRRHVRQRHDYSEDFSSAAARAYATATEMMRIMEPAVNPTLLVAKELAERFLKK